MSQKYIKRTKKGKGREIKRFKKKAKDFFAELSKDDVLAQFKVDILKAIITDLERD